MNFNRHDTYEALSAGKKDGVFVRELPGGVGEVRLALTQTELRVSWDDSGFYNGGRYHWGLLTSPTYEAWFDTLIPSWNAATPAGTWVQLEVRTRFGASSSWSRWFNMGVWTSGTQSVKRHSVDGQKSETWEVLTDTLQSRGPIFADAYQYRLTLFTERWGVSPRVRGVFVVASDSNRHKDCLGIAADESSSWGRELAVPVRSQLVYEEGGEAWCSPASLSMVMAYWAGKTSDASLDRSVPTVVQGTYDHVYGGNGNWPFNAAYASSFGLRASVNRLRLSQVER